MTEQKATAREVIPSVPPTQSAAPKNFEKERPISKSPGFLTQMSQQAFEQRQAALKERRAETELTFRPFRELVKNNPDIAKASERARQRFAKRKQMLDASHGEKPQHGESTDGHSSKIPHGSDGDQIDGNEGEESGTIQTKKSGDVDFMEKFSRKIEPQAKGFLPIITYRHPFDLEWKWSATTESATANAYASCSNGSFYVSSSSGSSGGSSVAKGAVGIRSPRGLDGLLSISANPWVSFNGVAERFLNGVHTGGYIGFYIAEYDFQGNKVRTVLEQRNSLWDHSADDGDFGGTYSGYSLSAKVWVNSNHYYDIWVLGGEDTEGTGSGLFWSNSAANLSVMVPDISIWMGT